MTRAIFILYIILSSVFQLTGQNEKLDSLWKEYKNARHDTNRINLLFDIGYIYEFFQPDTALLTYKKIIAITDKNLGKSKYTENETTRKYATLKAKAIMYTGIVVMDMARYPEAMKYYMLSKSIFTELNDIRGISNCLNNIGIIYQETGQLQQSLDAYYTSLHELEKLSDKKGIARNLNNIGIIYHDLGNYEKSLDSYIRSIKIKEELGDERGIALSYNNIGIVHKEQGNNQQAIEYYQKSLDIAIKIGDNKSAANAINNIANVYLDLGKEQKKKGNGKAAGEHYKKAIEFNLKSQKIREEIGDKKGVAHSLGNIANIYMQQRELKPALDYFNKSLVILKEIDEQAAIAGVYNNMSTLYALMADESALKNDGMQKTYLRYSVEYGEMGYEVSKQLGMLFYQSSHARTLMNTYRKSGNLNKALDYAEKFIELNDSLFSQDKTKALTEAEKKFESEKKQLQIEKLNKEKELQLSEILREKEKGQRQQLVIFFIIAGLLVLSVFAVFVVQRLRITRRQKRIIEEQKHVVDEKNILLLLQNEEIRTQRDEIEMQRDEIATQRDTVIKQRDFIEEQKKAITDSITYAKRIQQAMLHDFKPFLSKGNKLEVTEYFILFKPKDIVSGDFYWVSRINEMLIVVVADCTGHGVPGAFMSMLGMSFLDEIVRKKEITCAGDALDALRKNIIDALQQKESRRELRLPGSSLMANNTSSTSSSLISDSPSDDLSAVKDSPSDDLSAVKDSPSDELSAVKDGMDIALCAINMNTGILQFAGANNSLYLIRTSIAEDGRSASSMIELDADKQPVGIHVKMKPFTTQEIALEKGDRLYLMSDGYADQFGGPDGKKFRIKKLRNCFDFISANHYTFDILCNIDYIN
jgi:tetratricopeptide (TPR) repeat protein